MNRPLYTWVICVIGHLWQIDFCILRWTAITLAKNQIYQVCSRSTFWGFWSLNVLTVQQFTHISRNICTPLNVNFGLRFICLVLLTLPIAAGLSLRLHRCDTLHDMTVVIYCWSMGIENENLTALVNIYCQLTILQHFLNWIIVTRR